MKAPPNQSSLEGTEHFKLDLGPELSEILENMSVLRPKNVRPMNGSRFGLRCTVGGHFGVQIGVPKNGASVRPKNVRPMTGSRFGLRYTVSGHFGVQIGTKPAAQTCPRVSFWYSLANFAPAPASEPRKNRGGLPPVEVVDLRLDSSRTQETYTGGRYWQ